MVVGWRAPCFKRGFSSDANDESWDPLDDYQAPYREPVLPPVHFIPNDTGVGIPLPPEEDEVPKPLKETEIKSLPRTPDLYDEEKYISKMKNFHSARNAEGYNSSIEFLLNNLAKVARFLFCSLFEGG